MPQVILSLLIPVRTECISMYVLKSAVVHAMHTS